MGRMRKLYFAIYRAGLQSWLDSQQIITASIDATAYRVQDILHRGGPDVRERIFEALQNYVRKLPTLEKAAAQSCVITGWPRTGKTLISSELARKHGFSLISLDQLRDIYQPVEDDALRLEMRQFLLDELFKRFPVGLIVEGDDLIYVNRNRSSGPRNISLDVCGSLTNRHKVKCFVVGNADAAVDAKVDALRLYQKTGKCWTVKSERWRDLPARAAEMIEDSRRLRDMAPAHEVTYIEMDVINFGLSILNAAERIVATPAPAK